MTADSEFKRQQWRSRLVLLLIAAMFLGSFGLAALLRFSGWEPSHSKNFGTLLNPPIDFSSQTFKRADGSDYAWQPEKNRWRVVFASNKPCASECQKLLDTVHRVWLSQGRHTESIDVLWFAEVPANPPQFKGFVPMQANPTIIKVLLESVGSEDYSVYLIDSSGFLMMKYNAGFDPTGLKKDLAKLVK